MAVVPLIVGFLIAKKLFKLNVLDTMGSICGGMTSTPALGTLITSTGTDDVTTSYAATYPVALALIVIVVELIGGMMGIIGGPLGMLFGGSIGALTGSAVDASDEIHNASLIEKVTEQLVDGEIVLIALEQETEDGTAQKMLSKFDVSIVEEDAAEVAEEVERAIEAQKEMEREARAKLREAKKEDRRQKIEEHRAKLSADFETFKAKFKKE